MKQNDNEKCIHLNPIDPGYSDSICQLLDSNYDSDSDYSAVDDSDADPDFVLPDH